MRRISIAFVLVIAALALVGTIVAAALHSGESAQAQAPADKEIWLQDNFYAPSMVLVPPGTTVVWTNYGMHQHTITSKAGVWDSGPIVPKGEYRVTFTRPGTYEYFCRFHSKEMKGTVTVN